MAHARETEGELARAYPDRLPVAWWSADERFVYLVQRPGWVQGYRVWAADGVFSCRVQGVRYRLLDAGSSHAVRG